jgi:SAM-dependent methyltransferase
MTGERPVHGETPDALLALHEAGYREVARRLGNGAVLDAGCGLGFLTARLAAPGRLVVGVDYDLRAAAGAARSGGGAGLSVATGDAARLPFRDGAFDWVCSSHLIEHFDTPARHVAELARVLRRGGTAFFLTPNAPWDFENPYHLVLFDAEDLASLLSSYFEDVRVLALDASPRAAADFARRRAKAARLLRRLDPFDLRHRVPRRWWVAAYRVALPLSYRLLAQGDRGGRSGITAADYVLADEVGAATTVLFGVASSPRPPARGAGGGA